MATKSNETEVKEEVKATTKTATKKEVEVVEVKEDAQTALFNKVIQDMALSQAQQAKILEAIVDKTASQGESLAALTEAQLQKLIEDNPNMPGIRRESAVNTKGEAIVPVTLPRAYRDALGAKYDVMINCVSYRFIVDGKTPTMMPESIANYFMNDKLPRILDFHVEEESVESRSM